MGKRSGQMGPSQQGGSQISHSPMGCHFYQGTRQGGCWTHFPSQKGKRFRCQPTEGRSLDPSQARNGRQGDFLSMLPSGGQETWFHWSWNWQWYLFSNAPSQE